jgi:hypothetical protein
MRKGNLPLPGLAALVYAAAFLLFTTSGQTQQTLQVLHNHVRPAVNSGQAVPVGSLPSTQRMNLAIMLPLPNQLELTNFLARIIREDIASAQSLVQGGCKSR